MADSVDDLIAELVAILVDLLPGGDVDALPREEFVAELRDALRQVPDIVQPYRDEAYREGVREAGGDPPDDEIYEDLEELERWWSEQTEKLVTLVEHGEVEHQVVRARAESLLKREATTQLSAAQDQGLADQAEALGWDSIFVPERDACLWCTSYAGAVAHGGREEFEPVRNFTADARLGPITIPVHPWCRCKRQVVHPDDARSVARPLKREAERAVLRFESLPSESDRARTEAAARLLAAGTALPKTVIERSERAVRRRRKDEGPARKRRTTSP